ncbi:MAG: L-threonylcarbamoyladenylate synthase [bacterium]|nr:L-threonylcarbamoyladenylate synthase [bacterium]
MRIFKKQKEKIISILKSGGVGVMATDTIYGLVGSALNPKTVERVYRLRQRDKNKPLIILIGSLADLAIFGINPSSYHKKILKKLWPGKVSIIFSCRKEKFRYLHRGAKTLSFRLPANKELRNLLIAVGPLVAPSANPQGLKPAANIKKAKKYFGARVDFYNDSGRLPDQPSTLIQIKNNKVIVLRMGAVKIPKNI